MPRPGIAVVQVPNSGLEVWLYDAGNQGSIVESGILDPIVDDGALAPLFRAGTLAAYSLRQDDALHIGIVVGDPLTDDELAVAGWLEPQTAYLSLPTGVLRIESSDTAPILPEGGSDEGARLTVPAGDYRLTLYRIDHEALDREGRSWPGPFEIVVLTPGGGAADAATRILPFQPRRDLDWVGRYAIHGHRADAQVWFADAWDTVTVNLDRAAVGSLQLEPGHCIRLSLKKPKLSLVIAFASEWSEGAKLIPPDGLDLSEYGYGSLVLMAEWGAEALCCRRDRAKTGVKPRYLKTWLPATVERLDQIAEPPKRVRGPVLLDTPARAYWRGDLGQRSYYRDLQLLTAKLMSRVDGIPWGEELPLERALKLVDGQFADAGLQHAGDFSFDVQRGPSSVEYTNRLYLGLPDVFGVLWGSADVFDCFYCSETEDDRWVLTGTISAGAARAVSANPRLEVRGFTGRISAGAVAHREHLAELGATARAAPGDLATAVIAYDRYLQAALGG